jgi:undecaprenyl-diphosphatase
VHPISYLQAAILGLVQGAAELFPVSSLGHSVVLPRLLGWDIHQNDDAFLTFLVATHLATALVLLGFFWRDWKRIVSGLGRSLRDREIAPGDGDARLGWLLVVGTIPAGLLGLLLEHPLRRVFASPQSAAAFLFLNGVMLFGAEALRRRAPGPDPLLPDGDARIAARTTWNEALAVGAAQAIALLPGFSRSGATMGGGLLAGLSNEDAARSPSCSPHRSSALRRRSSSPTCLARRATACADRRCSARRARPPPPASPSGSSCGSSRPIA